MNSSDQNPKLPTWLFIVADVALVGAAAFIAWRSAQPLAHAAMLSIVGCLGAGVIVALVPLVLRFEQQKNEVLDDRQRALEALARTVSASAEQISIAAGGLHEIAEIAQKNLKQAEQLPHKLQDKIAEFTAQLATAEDAEREELERELLSLRTTESERLESVSQRIAKSSAEWTKLEAATQQHLAAATEALGKLSLGTASAIGKAQAAAEQALGQARIEAARTLGETSGQGTKALEAAKAAALADLDAKLSAAATMLVERVTTELAAKLSAATHALDAKIAQLETAARHAPAAPAEPTPAAPPAPTPAESAAEVAPPPSDAPSSTSSVAIASPADASIAAAPMPAPKRPRKPKREESTVPATTTVPAVPAAETPPVLSPETAARSEIAAEPVIAPADPAAPIAPAAPEPAPIPREQISEIAPVAPHTMEPFSGAELPANGSAAAAPPADSAPAPTAATPPTPSNDSAPKATRKRAPVAPPEPEPEPEPSLGLALDDTSATAASVAERIMTSDGATRLLVTAYIGIGNRLFIRGAGPGLTWEKGVPLQFVSIGKWRWETNDATTPVQFKLYKNDDVECGALGAQSLDPGHQQEVTAAF